MFNSIIYSNKRQVCVIFGNLFIGLNWRFEFMKSNDSIFISNFKHQNKSLFVLTALFYFTFNFAYSANPDWVVDVIDNPSPGYLSFDWQSDSSFSLMDNYATFHFPRNSTGYFKPFKLFKNGLWVAYSTKQFYLLDQNFQIVDSIPQPSNYGSDFHDVNLLSNGHYMLLCFEKRIMDLSKVVEGGKTNAAVIAAILVETDRTGKIYWEWKAIDHFLITDVTSDIDLTMQVVDFTHANSFLEDNDGNILISLRYLDEVTKIDRTTGKILWRAGGTFCKNNQFTFVNDTINGFYGFSHQHSISLLSNGNLLLYDNGNLKDPAYSRVVEYKINESAKTMTKVWEYRPNPDIVTPSMGSVHRLLNGNTCITFGTAITPIKVIELKPDKSVAFRLLYNGSPISSLLNLTRYITKMNAVSKQMSSPGNYIFNDSSFFTGVEIKVDDIIGGGFTAIEKHNYEPPTAEFSDSSFISIFPYRWVFSNQNINSISGTLKISVDSINNMTYPENIAIFMREKESKGVFKQLITNYDSKTKYITAPIAGFGEFILVSYKLGQPTLIFPSNNKDNVIINNILTWNKLQGATKYQVQLSTSNTFSKTVIDDTVAGKILYYNFKNLDYLTKYYWRVRGINTKDTSEWSDIFTFTTIENKIYIPILISPDNNKENISKNDSLVWEKVPSADSYIVQISTDADFISNNLDSVKVTDEFYLLKNVEHFKKYFWRVKSLKSTESTDWSEIRNFISDISVPKLNLPADKEINIQSSGILDWDSTAGAYAYQLQISENNNFVKLLIDSSGLTDTKYEFSNLEFNKEYFWKARAFRNSDTSDWSEVWSFNTVFPSPKLLKPEQNEIGVPLNSFLTWNSDINDCLYSVQISESPDFNFSLIDTNLLSENKIQLKSLYSNKLYFWRVKSHQEKKESGWSEIRNFFE